MIDLALVKMHLRIDGDAENNYLSRLIPAARRYSEQYCDRRIYDTADELAVDPAPEKGPILADETVDQAELMLIAHWYAVRETVGAVNMTEVPMATTAMLDMHRRKTL